MKPGVPWSIKGVEPELREAAKSAARRSGMTLGEWLNSAINEQADGYDDAPAPAPRARPVNRNRFDGAAPTHSFERAASTLEDIAQKLARLPVAGSDTSSRASQLEADVNFGKLLNRVDSYERQSAEALGVMNEKLSQITKQVTRHVAPPPPKFEETLSYQALEKAVRNIIEHLDVSDKRTRENMKALQDRMGEMSTKLNPSGNDQFLRQAPAFSQLESRLAELARKVDQPTQSPGDQLRNEIEQLANRIDTVRESSEQLASRAQTQAVQASQQELRAIEGRLIGLLNEAKQSIVQNGVGPAELQRFKGEIDKLHGRIDDAQRGAATDRDVSALKVAIEQLQNRISQNDSKPIADLDRRVIEIAQKLERAEQQGLGQPFMSEVERRLAELDQRLNGGSHQDHVQQKLNEVDDRLARTEQQLGHLDTIERAIAQLYEAFEDHRKNPPAQSVAELAADSSALANTPEIVALESGLRAVREAAEGADRRNQETLEAVHETLEQIVSKLAELETAAIGQRVGAAVAPAAAAENPFVREEEKVGRNPFEADHIHAMPDVLQSAPVTSEAVAENPFVPPAEVAPAATPEGGISDLIAAARRLHQQNNAQPGQLSSFVPGRSKQAKGKTKDSKSASKGFSLPFLGSADKLKSALKPANNNEGSKIRLAFLGFVLLGVAAFAVTNMAGRAYHKPAAQPAAIEQPATPPLANPAPAPLANPGDVPSLAAPDMGAASQNTVPSPPMPAPAPLASPGQQSDATSAMPQQPQLDDAITTGTLSKAAPAPKTVANTNSIGTLDPAVGPAKLRDAAAAGDATAQFIVASHYLNGDTTGQDYNKAAYWYGKAAAQGSAPAQYRLATLYERGTGVEKNLKTALSWYEQAGSMGNVKAMHNAAVLAAGNDAGGPNYDKAFKWFSLAAAHGLKDSEFNLAVLLERGLGTKQDANEALFWYMAAASQDDADAKARIGVLSKTLSPAMVAATQARFKAWVPEKAPDAANVVAVNDAQWNPSASIPTPMKSTGTATKTSSNDNPNDTAKRLLTGMGYRVGDLDGTLDSKTSNAIKLFQIRQGLKATGMVTPGLLAAMQSQADAG